ncbi:nucleotide sugar dehydrogenase [Candidatus Pelagibacter sp.]|nr:nucleotide sugar dehydrogenase [Candidatus Pelagibacter sp.]
MPQNNLISLNKKKVCIIGLGYVGLPLFLEFSKHFNTVGFDNDSSKVRTLKKNYNLDFKKILLTNDPKKINLCDFIIVCLPTPINSKNEPDLSILIKASKLIGKNIKKNSIIIYESTVYPTTTEKICLPIIENNSGLKEGKDFHIGYSPERINPGDNSHTIKNIVKVVSARNLNISKLIKNLYQKIIKPKVYIASSITVAETSKIIENVQRDINIALINELSLICSKLSIDTREVLEASGTKWNFLKFRPGLVGGHCIGVDPYYLSFLSKKIGHNPRLIDSGRKINDEMTNYVFKAIKSKLKKKNSKILIMGISFKKNCDDLRNSKVIELAEKLKTKYDVFLHDPHINTSRTKLDKKYKIINNFNKKKNIVLT